MNTVVINVNSFFFDHNIHILSYKFLSVINMHIKYVQYGDKNILFGFPVSVNDKLSIGK